ncbi:hypothetical protein UR09_06290 [Candidatus Nitromaritima sp. SCGC AAA799-A02]|nr:hypothetical protein UR09_06290 [Candidatus Nitromaritima sp. SCGC AAA799-A02]
MIQNQSFFCPKCKSGPVNSPLTKDYPCKYCSFPLDLNQMLKRIRGERDKITEVIQIDTLIPEWESIDLGKTMETIECNIDLIFPVKENNKFLVLRLLNDEFVFNFGSPGIWKFMCLL